MTITATGAPDRFTTPLYTVTEATRSSRSGWVSLCASR